MTRVCGGRRSSLSSTIKYMRSIGMMIDYTKVASDFDGYRVPSKGKYKDFYQKYKGQSMLILGVKRYRIDEYQLNDILGHKIWWN